MEDRNAERLARNETFFRDVNERISESASSLGGPTHPYEFLCECSDPTCTARVELTRVEYEHVRASPTRFVLEPGHQAAAIEQVVEQRPDHVLVEKVGPAAAVAKALDPRTD